MSLQRNANMLASLVLSSIAELLMLSEIGHKKVKVKPGYLI